MVSLTSCINNPGNQQCDIQSLIPNYIFNNKQMSILMESWTDSWFKNHANMTSPANTPSPTAGRRSYNSENFFFFCVQLVVPTCLRGMVRPLPICPFFILLSSSGFPFCCKTQTKTRLSNGKHTQPGVNECTEVTKCTKITECMYKVHWVLCCYDYAGLVVAWCQCAQACAEAVGCWSVV